MADRLTRFVLPGFMFAALVLGGSAQALWGKLLLELGAVALIVAVLLATRERKLEGSDRFVMAMIALVVALVVIQLAPLPPALWTVVPGRAQIARGYGLLGLPLPWLPLSMAPKDTLATAITLLPGLAMLMAVLWLPAVRRGWISMALVLGAVASLMLGTLQVTTGGPDGASRWYLYPDTNFGVATGFFANCNHMAILLVAALPFLASLAMRLLKGKRSQRNIGLMGIAAGLAGLFLVGIYLSGSLAAAGLCIPALLGAWALIARPGRTMRWILLGGALAVGILALVIMMNGGAPASMRSAGNVASFETRAEFARGTVALLPHYMPFGSAIGTFDKIYPLVENADSVTRDFVNHAHDDYLELALETGIPGLLLVAAFLLWWAGRTIAIWRSVASGGQARAATIAAGVLLLHSVVDFPLRTIGLDVVFAYSIALMALPIARSRVEQGEEARHLRMG